MAWKYRILERRADGDFSPFGVAYEHDQGGVYLFSPMWRGDRALDVGSMDELEPRHFPSYGDYRWAGIRTSTTRIDDPIELLEEAFAAAEATAVRGELDPAPAIRDDAPGSKSATMTPPVGDDAAFAPRADRPAFKAASFAALLSRARHNDKKALNELFEGYRPMLRTLAWEEMSGQLGRKAGRDNAEHAVDACYLEAGKKLPGFEGEDERAFQRWLGRILQEVIQQEVARIGEREAEKMAIMREAQTHAGRRQLAASLSLPADDVVYLERAFGFLDKKERRVIELRYFEDRSVSVIADLEGIKKKTVRRRILSALRALDKAIHRLKQTDS
jgi:RNA polymerase sigma factor (sigma-70 family)